MGQSEMTGFLPCRRLTEVYYILPSLLALSFHRHLAPHCRNGLVLERCGAPTPKWGVIRMWLPTRTTCFLGSIPSSFRTRTGYFSPWPVSAGPLFPIPTCVQCG